MKASTPTSDKLPRFLFRVSLLAITMLVGLVVGCPFLEAGGKETRGAARVVTLFAQDKTVRRTALGVAFGLGATAGIFFWPQLRSRTGSPRLAKPPTPPGTAMGA